MKAILHRRFGPPEELQLEEIPRPEPAAGGAPERGLAPKPRNLSFERAAALPIAAMTAFHGLRERIPPGRTVLITGAAGGVGSFAVQIAKLLGAEVTGVCHRQTLDFVRSLGA